jgi:hypothetical protein
LGFARLTYVGGLRMAHSLEAPCLVLLGLARNGARSNV